MIHEKARTTSDEVQTELSDGFDSEGKLPIDSIQFGIVTQAKMMTSRMTRWTVEQPFPPSFDFFDFFFLCGSTARTLNGSTVNLTFG